MGTGSFFSSNLFSLYNVIQNTQILAPKELLLSNLRNYFSKDTKYHYVKDAWGFPKTGDLTDVPSNAGTNDDLTTRIFIGTEQRFDIAYFPAVIVKYSGGTFVPISINEEQDCIQYDYRLYIDGYGKKYNVQIPVGFIYAGAYESTFSIDVLTEGPQDRSTIVEAICMLFQSIARNELTRAGLFIKSVKTDAESSEIYQNDMVYKQTITLECRSEYRRLIPIENIVEVIDLCVEFGNIGNNLPDPNLQINYQFSFDDIIAQAQPI